MSKLGQIIAATASLLMLGAGASMASASSQQRALSLNVIEGSDTVEVQVIADSALTQQVEFEVELSGASHSRHKSNVTLASGNRQVLSRLKINTTQSWCAKLIVSEASGEQYTLTAGECGLI
ncbi:hypothetical protein INR77_15120 [Erythrobacter sp. SCSIO 43205]|uniref:hypothetical protein n=1 Tax=Erythrobacter sp. SCSIO 43205 TaxID=2779361 RepID=UPI001CA7D6F3|nr:hypothetical protein [Erythrobacter sp. SCSIO 43205]UAB78067.1 hypothetical protein INR77_15120 [Erythrobacter sp. SCSIO 43205]